MPPSGLPALPGPGLDKDADPACAAWVRAADLVTVVLLCGALWVFLSGGFRFSVIGVRVSVTSPERLMVLALAVTGVRHAGHRRPSLLARARSFRSRWLSPAWSATARVWAVSRFSVIAVGFLAVPTIGFPGSPPVGPWDSTLLDLPARWDATWYLDIAVHGYRWSAATSEQQNVAFFPGFPLTMRAGGGLLGAYPRGLDQRRFEQRLLMGGWLVALGTFWWALVYVYRWSDARGGSGVAQATVTLLAAYPFAVYFSAPYSEPLYLLATTAAFFHFERSEWCRAAVWGFVTGLTRPSGVLLTAPLALVALRAQTRTSFFSWPQPAAYLALAAPPAALALHMLYLRQLTGRWFAWTEVQVAWGRTYEVAQWLRLEFVHLADVGVLRYLEGAPVTTMNGLAALMALVLLWRVTKAAGPPYTLFVLVNLVPAIASGGLLSVGRFTSTLFPLFFALAVLIRDRQLPVWVVAFAVGQGLIAGLFFTWRPPV